MFGQNHDDQQQAQDDQSVFNQPFDAGFSPAAQVPAPGAPAGPITDDGSNGDSGLPLESVPAPVTISTPPADVPADELLDIKQEALHELSPLVGHLEQTPEEKFKTTMMMIQASDDHSLIRAAYDAAKQITDEKARAQALLDVVNEINYFTQQHNS